MKNIRTSNHFGVGRALSFCFLLCLFSMPFRARAQSFTGGDVLSGKTTVVTNVLAARVQSPPAITAGTSANVTVVLKVKEGFHVNANPPSEQGFIATAISLDPSADLSFGKPLYPPGEKKKFSFSDKPLAVYQGETKIQVPIQIEASAAGGARTIKGHVRYQACNDQNCLLPTSAAFQVALRIVSDPKNATSATSRSSTKVAPIAALDSETTIAAQLQKQHGVVGLPSIVFLDAQGRERTDLRAGEELTLASFEGKLASLGSGAKTNATDEGGASSWMDRLRNASLWWQLALVFGGGLLLNLTPCVYPMIPITIGYFGAQSEGRASKTFGLALLYVLGLALVYSTLGVFAAFTGTLFGSLLQSPFVVGAVALVLGILALSMMGVFTINPPQFLMQRSGAKKGAWGALGMGALLGVVAAPCVGPVVAALLTYVGTKKDPQLGFLLFFFLSLGLGLPYLLLGIFSGTLKSLPRSGAWLERSKKIFAVPLLLAALYYGYSAIRPASASIAAETGEHWPRATLAALDQARAQNRPVVLDFRADWCLPCLKLEREVFSRSEVRRMAQQKNILLLQVDLTRAGS